MSLYHDWRPVCMEPEKLATRWPGPRRASVPSLIMRESQWFCVLVFFYLTCSSHCFTVFELPCGFQCGILSRKHVRTMKNCLLPYRKHLLHKASRVFMATNNDKMEDRAPELPLSTMPHEDVYLVDSNLVIGYLKNDIAGWKDWADQHIAQGKKFYVMRQTIDEVLEKHPNLPDGFEPLRLESPIYEKPQARLDSVYKEVVADFRLTGRLMTELKKDVELIAQAGYYAGCADRIQIPDDDIFADRVVFASNNFVVIQRLLYTQAKTRKMEKILDDCGFEHLINVRFVSSAQTWRDFF